MKPPMTAQMADESLSTSNAIQPLLRGRHPMVQGAVLADLVSLWIAGHHPDMRAEIEKQWLDVVHQMIPASEAQIFARSGKPPDWP